MREGEGGTEGRGLARGESPREGVWSAAPRPVRASARPVSRALGGLVLAPIVLRALLPVQHPLLWDGVDAVGLLLWGAALALVVGRRAAERRARRVTPADLRFSDRPPGVEESALEIVIVDDGREIGADRGFLWFEGDRLHFTGAATSFTLGPQDLFPRQTIAGKDPYHGLPPDCVRLRRPGRPTFVRLLPLRGVPAHDLGRRIGAFVAREASEGARQWPPLRRYREGEGDPGATPARG